MSNIEQLFIYRTRYAGPGCYEVDLIAQRNGDIFTGDGPNRDTALDHAFQTARRQRRFSYPSLVYCSDEYFRQMYGFS